MMTGRLSKLFLAISIGTLVAVAILLVFGIGAAPCRAQPARPQDGQSAALLAVDHGDAISKALSYLHTQQNPDGGFSSAFGEFSAIRVVLAVAAARRPISTMTSISGHTPLDYLATRAVTYTHDATGTLKPGSAGQLAAAVVGAGHDPAAFGGMNLIAELTSTYQAASGAYSTTAGGGDATTQWWAILGLAAAQEVVPVPATDYLVSKQLPDGGWGSPAWGSDVDSTAFSLQALLASGNVEATAASVQGGLAYLEAQQSELGGWGYLDWWTGEFVLSPDSTAAAIQALAAVGYVPATASWARTQDPHTALASLQAITGSFAGYDPVLATADAIPGLAEAPLPILGPAQRAERALAWMSELQLTDGSWPTGGFGHPGGPTCDAVLAYAAAGYDPHTLVALGSITSAVDYLSATASAYVIVSADAAGKLLLAVEAAGKDGRDFGGLDLVQVMSDTWYSPTLGVFSDADNAWHQAFAILGLAAAEESIPVSVTQALLDLQSADGSWTDAWGYDKPGSTGLALQALIAAGVPASDPSIVSGTTSLQRGQNSQGSWDAFGSPSANSTAYAMQGLLAAGEDLRAEEWLKGGHSPYEALMDLQRIDGPFAFWGADDFFSTRQAVPALVGAYYPLSNTLAPFSTVYRGPDPDRLVAVTPRTAWGNSVDLVIPFGSDLDGDATVELNWRMPGATSWVTGTSVHRNDGYYTATVPVTRLLGYEFQVTFVDPDRVQYRGDLTDTVRLSTTFDVERVLMPFVLGEN
jgi:squalene cyclase